MSAESKRLLAAGIVVLVALFLYSVREILPAFILAMLLVYLLTPLVDGIQRFLRLPRGLAILLLYVAFFLIITGPIAALLPSLLRQLQQFVQDFQGILNRLEELANQREPMVVNGFTIDWQQVYDQVIGSAQTAVTFAASWTVGLVVNVVSQIGWVALVLVITFYLLKDTPRLKTMVQGLGPESVSRRMVAVLEEVSELFGMFLRGQLMLMLAVGLMTTVILMLIGLRYAVWMGVLAGVLEIVPIIGPIISAVPAVLIALFQEPTPFGLSPWVFALIVVGIYVLVQQVENHVLVPMILGRAVNLHPAAVIFAVLAGASLGGLLGVFLAVPVMASMRIVARHLWALFMDEPVPAAVPGVEPVPAVDGQPMPAEDRGRGQGIKEMAVKVRRSLPSLLKRRWPVKGS